MTTNTNTRASQLRNIAENATITAANGRTYYAQPVTASMVQFTTPDHTRHSFMDSASVSVCALYEDAAHVHFVGLLVDTWAHIDLYVAPFVKSFRIDHAQSKRMNTCALDGSGVAVPVSRKMHNNRKAAQARREREQARFAYAHAARNRK